jgi:hypothetical protein
MIKWKTNILENPNVIKLWAVDKYLLLRKATDMGRPPQLIWVNVENHHAFM